MQLQTNISLRPYNTFHIDACADSFYELSDESALPALSLLPDAKKVIGGGSNVLLTGRVPGLLIRNGLRGITVVREDDTHLWLDVKAGENWHQLVLYAIGQNLGGLENLSLIPGCVGAAPMQNIGAYGVEVKDVIESVTAWHWEKQQFITLQNADCQFGYRESIFKHALKEQVLITSVVFRLNKQHVLNTSYGAIRDQLNIHGVAQPTIKDVSEAVIAIRQSKLPDPAVVGNAGSFFKNPTIAASQFLELQAAEKDIPSYPVSDTSVKVPAGWLIERCGWKGFRRGDAGVHPKQALVLVNYGQASGSEIWDLSSEIVRSVEERFGILLEREVNVW